MSTFTFKSVGGIVIDIDPVAKPRMTRRDKWAERPSVMRYRAYKDALNLKFKGTLGDTISMTFIIPMPDSWSKKKKIEMNETPHQQKPDIDNLIKGFLDALLEEDSHIYSIEASKFWGYKGKIVIW